MEMLGVAWMPLDGAAEDGATQLVAGSGGAGEGEADYDLTQTLQGPGEPETTAWGARGCCARSAWCRRWTARACRRRTWRTSSRRREGTKPRRVQYTRQWTRR
eukprot:6035682-Pleurochrysis_carterae.AAC.1